MVCIYCGGTTQVTNSRPQKRLNHTWRRRECVVCHAIFTTEEAADYSSSMVVRHSDASAKAAVQPFSRDKLFLSLHQALGHRKTAVEDAGALCATITAKLLHGTREAVVSPADIVEATLQTLRHFDMAAAVQYQAYHQN